MSRERRLVGGRDYQTLVETLKDALTRLRQATAELSDPNLPADYRQRWAKKAETAYADGLEALWDLESIGRAVKGGRLTEDNDEPAGTT